MGCQKSAPRVLAIANRNIMPRHNPPLRWFVPFYNVRGGTLFQDIMPTFQYSCTDQQTFCQDLQSSFRVALSHTISHLRQHSSGSIAPPKVWIQAIPFPRLYCVKPSLSSSVSPRRDAKVDLTCLRENPEMDNFCLSDCAESHFMVLFEYLTRMFSSY